MAATAADLVEKAAVAAAVQDLVLPGLPGQTLSHQRGPGDHVQWMGARVAGAAARQRVHERYAIRAPGSAAQSPPHT